MVDHAFRLIVVYTDTPSVTKETIKYARVQGLNIVSITDETNIRRCYCVG